MRHSVRTGAVISAVLVLGCAGVAWSVDPLPLQPHVEPAGRHPSRMLVRFAPQSIASGPRDLSREIPGSRVIRSFTAVPGLTLVDVPPGQVDGAIAAAMARGDVMYAEPDYQVELLATPNDPLFSQLWGLQNTGQVVNADPGTPGADIRATQAWDLWTGDPDFKIAVIDSGVNYKHPDLAANIWTNTGEIPGNGIDDDLNGYVDDVHGYDFWLETGDSLDDVGHGSHIAGTIGAVANDARGLVGVNWKCKIVALRFAGAAGGGFTSDAIEALQYVLDNDIRVSNNSWGCYECFQQSLRDAIEATQAVGHIFVAASGNGIFGLGVDSDQFPLFPAAYDLPNIISVAAIDNDDEKAKFSNFGAETVDIGAPGVNVLSTITGEDFGFNTGTSMATPHVVGVVSLLASRRPELTWEEIVARVLATARPNESLQGITTTGGVVDALSAIGDCNENGIFDEFDILTGTSLDCNMNGLPDECEPDCDGNEVADECDIIIGGSPDCDVNGVPDQCQFDCNGNSVADVCDIRDFASNDCNANGIPDECEIGYDQDCNSNGIPDLCDFYNGASHDCNENTIPDECDISGGSSADCTANGLPDDCERDCNNNGVADSCDIQDGASNDIDGDGVPDECALGVSMVPISATHTPVIDGQEIRIVEGGDTITFELRMNGWDPNQDGTPRIRFYQLGLDASGFTSGDRGSLSLARIPCLNNNDCLGESECTSEGICDPTGSLIIDESHPNFIFAGKPAIVLTDVSRTRLGSTLFYTSDAVVDAGVPRYGATVTLDVSDDAVGTFTLGFNPKETFYGDEREPTETFLPASLLPAIVVIAPDCNRNGAPDEFDLESGVSQDCDADGVPDECVPTERDCNGNLIPDVCDTRDGTSIDCNENTIPDECIHLESDCNGNHIPDACDMATGFSEDCNGNGVPDECIALEEDCDGNLVPDACDVAMGVLQDCDASDVPDICENDCNGNGLEDSCDIGDGRSKDHDGNGVPDECQITLHVPADFPTIQQAIDAAVRGDTVQLGSLAYRGTGNTNLDFRGKGITLRGNGAEETWIDCTGAQAGVLFLSAEDQAARVEDITIANAFNAGIVCFGSSPIIRRCTITHCGPAFAGMHVADGSAPLIEDCLFSENMVVFSGAGILANQSHPIIRRCRFVGNSAAEFGGAVYGFASNLMMEDCDMEGNRAGRGGGGVALVNGTPLITRCTFVGNVTGSASGAFGAGGALHLLQTRAAISSSLFSGNSSRKLGGGIYLKDGDPTLTNLTVTGNYAAEFGGAVYQDGPGALVGACCYVGECAPGMSRSACNAVSGVLYPGLGCSQIVCGRRSCCMPDGTCQNRTTIDCALAGGMPQEAGSHCSTRDCTPTLRNSIVWNNRASAEPSFASRVPFLTTVDSIVQPFWSGEGNTDSHPDFLVDGVWLKGNIWSEGDYHLSPSSAAVDTGVDQWVPSEVHRDLDGYPRVLCASVDRGAFESGIGDFDCNGVLDRLDFVHWSTCFTGLVTSSYADGCESFDFDADGDVDLRDFARFQNTLGASN